MVAGKKESKNLIMQITQKIAEFDDIAQKYKKIKETRYSTYILQDRAIGDVKKTLQGLLSSLRASSTSVILQASEFESASTAKAFLEEVKNCFSELGQKIVKFEKEAELSKDQEDEENAEDEESFYQVLLKLKACKTTIENQISLYPIKENLDEVGLKIEKLQSIVTDIELAETKDKDRRHSSTYMENFKSLFDQEYSELVESSQFSATNTAETIQILRESLKKSEDSLSTIEETAAIRRVKETQKELSRKLELLAILLQKRFSAAVIEKFPPQFFSPAPSVLLSNPPSNGGRNFFSTHLSSQIPYKVEVETEEEEQKRKSREDLVKRQENIRNKWEQTPSPQINNPQNQLPIVIPPVVSIPITSTTVPHTPPAAQSNNQFRVKMVLGIVFAGGVVAPLAADAYARTSSGDVANKLNSDGGIPKLNVPEVIAIATFAAIVIGCVALYANNRKSKKPVTDPNPNPDQTLVVASTNTYGTK